RSFARGSRRGGRSTRRRRLPTRAYANRRQKQLLQPAQLEPAELTSAERGAAEEGLSCGLDDVDETGEGLPIAQLVPVHIEGHARPRSQPRLSAGTFDPLADAEHRREPPRRPPHVPRAVEIHRLS